MKTVVRFHGGSLDGTEEILEGSPGFARHYINMPINSDLPEAERYPSHREALAQGKEVYTRSGTCRIPGIVYIDMQLEKP